MQILCFIFIEYVIYFMLQPLKIVNTVILIQFYERKTSIIYYASPSSEGAYSDRQRTPNFELRHENSCVSTCFHMIILKSCLFVCLSFHLSVCPYPEKRNHPRFVNNSPTVVIDTSIEKSSRVLQHGNQFFQKRSKFEF